MRGSTIVRRIYTVYYQLDKTLQFVTYTKATYTQVNYTQVTCRQVHVLCTHRKVDPQAGKLTDSEKAKSSMKESSIKALS